MKKQALAAALTGMLGATAQAQVIDLFDVLQTSVEDTTSGGAVGDVLTGTGVGSTQNGPITSIIGGQRDLGANKLSGGSSDDGTKIGVVTDGSKSYLSFSNDAGVSGEGMVAWDGQDDNDWTTFDPTGLGGIDLTDGGTLTAFVLETISADADWQFTIEIYTNNTKWTKITLPASEVPSGDPPVISVIPFTPFTLPEAVCDADPMTVDCEVGPGGNVDLMNVGAMRVHLNATGVTDIDLRLDYVSRIPEPASLALISLGLLGVGAFTRKKGRTSMA